MSGFIINTNVKAMNAQTNTSVTGRNLANSLEKLSSGLRINKSADDASGMAIADSLRSQANTLGQAIRNTNDAIAMVQIADKAMDEQIKILDTIKTKAAQAAQDTQNYESRAAIQRDVVRLIEQLDNIATQTSYNGLKMLSGSFTNKEFQVGAYSNETIRTSIGATSSDKIGSVRKETGANVTAAGSATLTFTVRDKEITLESVKISTSAGTGLGVLAQTINKNSDLLGGIRASVQVKSVGATAIASGAVTGLTINGIVIGDVVVDEADRNGNLRNAINKYSTETGVVASVDHEGKLELTSTDGRGIKVSGGGDMATATGIAGGKDENYGRLTLTSLSSNDIIVEADTGEDVGLGTMSEHTFNLRSVTGIYNNEEMDAAGGFGQAGYNGGAATDNFGSGVTTRESAMVVMDIAESAIQLLDKIRSDVGSVQSQLEVTLNNISVTQVNVKAAESGIRDVDFGSESSNFSKQNILM